MFDTVLIANRGEIAVRIMATLRRMGVRSVAIYSDEDEGARHVGEADEAVYVGATPAHESYLNIARVLDAARTSGAQAIHPGYGFLSENASFVRACEEMGIVFIGPGVDAVEMMGDKIKAKAAVAAAGVPVVPGRAHAAMDDRELAEAAREMGFPVLVKPSAGGGGKGMRLVTSSDGLDEALVSARRESAAAFGDDTLFIERYIETPRHLEVQILMDTFGTAVHLGERECSLQRRHQKVIEEAPSPLLDQRGRDALTAAALRVGEVARYRGVGTVEFIVSAQRPQEFYFMEMNTRLQVEHPVTEMVTGIDLVEQQVRVAAGEPLAFSQDDVHLRGHAIEARIYAEDASRDFLPTGGDVLYLREPGGEGVRVDSSLRPGLHVGTTYDPLLAKIIAHGHTREVACGRLQRALDEFTTVGVVTNTSFLGSLVRSEEVRRGELNTDLIARFLERTRDDSPDETELSRLAASYAVAQLWNGQRCAASDSRFDILDGWRVGQHASTTFSVVTAQARPITMWVSGTWDESRVGLHRDDPGVSVRCLSACEVANGVVELLLSVDGHTTRAIVAAEGSVTWIVSGAKTTSWRLAPTGRRNDDVDAHDGEVRSPMPGVVIDVAVHVGDDVARGDAVMVVEAMKMEYPLRAPLSGVVTQLLVGPGNQVVLDQVVARVEVAPTGEAPESTWGGRT